MRRSLLLWPLAGLVFATTGAGPPSAQAPAKLDPMVVVARDPGTRGVDIVEVRGQNGDGLSTPVGVRLAFDEGSLRFGEVEVFLVAEGASAEAPRLARSTLAIEPGWNGRVLGLSLDRPAGAEQGGVFALHAEARLSVRGGEGADRFGYGELLLGSSSPTPVVFGPARADCDLGAVDLFAGQNGNQCPLLFATGGADPLKVSSGHDNGPVLEVLVRGLARDCEDGTLHSVLLSGWSSVLPGADNGLLATERALAVRDYLGGRLGEVCQAPAPGGDFFILDPEAGRATSRFGAGWDDYAPNQCVQVWLRRCGGP